MRVKEKEVLLILWGATKNYRFGAFDIKKLMKMAAPELSMSQIKRLIQQGSVEVELIEREVKK